MNKGGRPAIFIGCKAEHRRIRFERNGHSRAFSARWRPKLGLFEFQLSGYGMKPHKFFGPSKGLAVANLRLRSSVSPANGWRWIYVDESSDWGAGGDPVGDWIYSPPGHPGVMPVCRTLPAASKDRVKQARAFFA